MQKAMLLTMATLVLSGCFGLGSQQLSEEEARAVTEQALVDFAQDLSSADGGDLRLVRGEFGGGSSGTAIGGDITFEMEWGRQGNSRVQLSAAGSGATQELQVFCSPDRVVLVFGEQRFEQRASQGSCLESVQQGSDPLNVDQISDQNITAVQPHDDGSVTATLAQEGNVTVRIDAQGRLQRIEFGGDGEDGSGVLRVEYGPRQTIQVPEAQQRLPALVYGAGQFTGGQYEWSAYSATQDAPLGEIEVRVVDTDNATVASFPLQDGSQTQSGFTFTFDDDGDGRFGQGDSFTVRGDSWTQSGQFDVLVWDTWADAEVGDVPAPGLPVLGLLAALGAVALGLRRR